MRLDEKSLKRENKLKQVSYSQMTSDDISFLEEQCIINWVWPEKYWKWIRDLMTWLFKFLDFKRHDVWFWQQIWFNKANWGILKYSFISLADEYRQICKEGLKKLHLIPKFYILLFPKVIIILLGYNAVESKKWLEAYNNSK